MLTCTRKGCDPSGGVALGSWLPGCHASGRSGGGADYGADHHSCGIMLLTCRQRVCAPQRDRDLDFSLGDEWQEEHFLLLPNSPDWAQ